MASFLVKFEGPSLTADQRERLARANLPIMLEAGAAWEGQQLEMTSHTVKVEADKLEAAEARVREVLPDYHFGPFETQPYPSEVAA